MTQKITGGYLPGSDPESQKANLAYRQALDRLQQTLDARQGRFFDPQMLAIAQGFLTPGKTGSFGEGLGFAAGNLREAQAQQEKEDREIAQAQLGVAAQGLELERLRQREKRISGLRTGEPLTAGVSGGLPTTGPRGALSQIDRPKGFENVEGVPFMPPNPNFMTRNQYLDIVEGENVPMSEIIKNLRDIEKDRYQERELGMVDRATGQLYPFPVGEPVKKQIFVPNRGFTNITVNRRQAALLDFYRENQMDDKYINLVNSIVSQPSTTTTKTEEKTSGEVKAPEGAGPPTVVAKAPKKTDQIKSVAQVAAEEKAAEERASGLEKKQLKGIEDWEKKESEASQMQEDFRIIRGIMDPSNPYSGEISGVFEKGTALSQFGRLIESGLTGEALAKSIRDITTQAGLDEVGIAQLQNFMSAVARLKLGASSLIKGEGSVTENERLLTAATTVTEKDTLKTILAKTEHLLARARFNEERTQLFREYQRQGKGFYDDFKDSDEYKGLKDRYDNEVREILEKRLKIKLPPRKRAGRDNTMAAGKLD